MDTSYDVRIYKTDVYKGKRTTTYNVRWSVGGRRFKEPFKTTALAESFRSELVAAARKGEAFRVEDGQPVSAARASKETPWFTLACDFADMKWPRSAATTRRTHAEALMTATLAMLTNIGGRPESEVLRRALGRWAFNPVLRDRDDRPEDIVRALDWLKRGTLPVSALRKPDILRALLDGLTRKVDGEQAAPSVVSRKRRIIGTLMEYAVERGVLDENPIPALKWSAPQTSQGIDRRRVANPVQARTLIQSVGTQRRSGPRLVAFFGCLYYAALRPEEAVALNKHDLSLPAAGWGTLYVGRAEPYAGRHWTDSGKNRDARQLKQRARGEVRPVPSPPELTALLHAHMKQFGTAPDGRLFRGERNGEELPKLTIIRAWKRARLETFTPEVAATPLAGTPYDLRHAAVSTWLNGGVPATTVAEWAGHSVEVLLKIYAKCLYGSDVLTQQRVQAALGHRTG
ncbi:tyrosine-type recombinase/integrase [Actinokineospora fastidiosa]|uniref:Integrase n=1 Tax=Actinokineospora fastidiosa TaxID=1816 RepID=A0A918GUR7_9PSEU|nr:integrase [Actinokineospora fastidiosa]GGS61439.1 integrase [Actinokineospora fastidiosa]